jgi:hypothetical protein
MNESEKRFEDKFVWKMGDIHIEYPKKPDDKKKES